MADTKPENGSATEARLTAIKVRWLERNVGVMYMDPATGKLRSTGVNQRDFATQCCRDAYDAIATGYQESGEHLSDAVLTETIPGSVFDIAIAHNWAQMESFDPPPRRTVSQSSWLRPDPRSIESAAAFYRADPPYGPPKPQPTPKPPMVPFGSHQVSEPYRASFVARVFAGRIEHWKHEATRSEREKQISPEPESEIVQGEPPNEQGDLTARRKALLADYKTALGNPSSYSIYMAGNSGINKPEFYAWVNGQLPESSKTTKKFEKFLLQRKRPISKKPSEL